jgi:copper(I)-binding protein
MMKNSDYHCAFQERMRVILSAALFACIALGAPASAAATGVTVESPWMRFIIKARPAGGYFTLHNDTS